MDKAFVVYIWIKTIVLSIPAAYVAWHMKEGLDCYIMGIYVDNFLRGFLFITSIAAVAMCYITTHVFNKRRQWQKTGTI